MVKHLLYKHRSLVALFIIMLVLDAVTTCCFMAKAGPHEEFHPLVRQVSIFFGPFIGPFIGAFYKALGGLLICLARPRWTQPFLACASMTYGFAVLYNIWAVDLYTSGVITWLPF